MSRVLRWHRLSSITPEPFWVIRTFEIIRRVMQRRLLWIVLISFFLLSGCVRYDVGIQFSDSNHGSITQRIRLDNQVTGVSRATALIWLNQLAQQAEQIGGQARQPSEQELLITIPFHNVKDLNHKFDGFFQAVTDVHLVSQKARQNQLPVTPVSQFDLQTHNLFLWQWQRLTYDLDLRSLSTISTLTNTKAFLIDPQDLLRLEFTLNTPWGARSGQPPDQSSSTNPSPQSLTPFSRRQGKQLVWTLKPGTVNHLEAVFWLPNPIGIGTTLIVVTVLLGMFLKAWNHPSSLIDLPSDLQDS